MEEEKLAALFSDLRQEDERRAPPFAQVCRAAEARHMPARPRAWRAVAAVAAGVLLVAGTALFIYGPPGGPGANQTPQIANSHAPGTPQASELEITRWRSPTAFLLEPPRAPASSSGAA